jgi:hypothetical protein
MVPLYAARIEDLGPGDFVKIDCVACGHTALLTPAFPVPLVLEPRHRVFDLKDRVRCRGVRCSGPGRRVRQMGKDAASVTRYLPNSIAHCLDLRNTTDAPRRSACWSCRAPVNLKVSRVVLPVGMLQLSSQSRQRDRPDRCRLPSI